MVNINQILKYTPAKIKKRTIKTVRSVTLVRAEYDIDELGKNQKARFRTE